jgi:hypothetical protein
LQPRNQWLQVLNDYMYDFNHKLLLWILVFKSYNHYILMGNVTSKQWNGSKMEGINFIACISYIWHPWLMTKWCGHPIVITMIKKWLQVIWYDHIQTYSHLPTNLPTYLPTHQPTYLPTNILLPISYNLSTSYLPHNIVMIWNVK